MKLTKAKKIILAVGLQVLVILAVVLYKLIILTAGTEVFLKIEPVDPRDPFRGDYITFQYLISDVSAYQVSDATIKNGDTVYVTLQKHGRYWSVDKVTKNKPKAIEEIFIKGKVESGAAVGKNFKGGQNFSQMHIVYGIEQYFIPEGTGRNANLNGNNAAAKVSIDSNGNAVIKQVYINNQPWP